MTVETVTCDSFNVYPYFGDYYVNVLRYGADVSVMILSNKFPNYVDDMGYLINNAMKEPNVLTDEQKKEKCRVLINNSVIKEMTLEEVFKFKNEYLDGQHHEHKILVSVECKKQEKQCHVNIKNKNEVTSFLNQLYLFYITVEKKLDESGYPIHDYSRCDNNYKSVNDRLRESIENYENFNSKNLVELYPIVKDLYWSLADFIKYCIEHRLNVNLKLPNVGKIKEYYEKINIEPIKSFDSSAGSQKACLNFS